MDLPSLVKKYNMNVTGILHIGGHHAEELPIYRSLWPTIPIVMFEPAPDNFKVLEENTKHDSNVTCINRGLGPFSCRMDMNVETANSGQSNSVLTPKLHKTLYPGITFDSKVEVRIDALDKYECSEKLNFINIDVQGFELQIFHGAKKTLKNIDYIMSEVNRAELYEGCALVEEIDEFLGKFGFKHVEEYYPLPSWGDVIYIKS